MRLRLSVAPNLDLDQSDLVRAVAEADGQID